MEISKNDRWFITMRKKTPHVQELLQHLKGRPDFDNIEEVLKLCVIYYTTYTNWLIN